MARKSISKYPWPASRLGVREMEILYRMSRKRSLPINEFLRRLVERANALEISMKEEEHR